MHWGISHVLNFQRDEETIPPQCSCNKQVRIQEANNLWVGIYPNSPLKSMHNKRFTVITKVLEISNSPHLLQSHKITACIYIYI